MHAVTMNTISPQKEKIRYSKCRGTISLYWCLQNITNKLVYYYGLNLMKISFRENLLWQKMERKLYDKNDNWSHQPISEVLTSVTLWTGWKRIAYEN